MNDDIHLRLGAYVLGGLTSAERQAFEAHLPMCSPCRSELTDNAGIPALLSRAAASPSIQPSESLRQRLLADVARARSRRRLRTGLVATAACVLASAGATALTTSRSAAPAGHYVALSADNGSTIDGGAVLARKPWGTAVTLTITGLPAAGQFSLQIRDHAGHDQVAATWAATSTSRVIVAGASSLSETDIATMRVVTASGAVLAHASG